MSSYDQYRASHPNIIMDRQDGILELRLHTNGGTFLWDDLADSIADTLTLVAGDNENRVVILTGTGDAFCGGRVSTYGSTIHGRTATPVAFYSGRRATERLLNSILDIPVPTIAAVNGPAHVHSELPLLCDVVLAADTTSFKETGHFRNGIPAGDGVHIVWPMLLGPNRGRSFLLTGEILDANESLRMGVVSEVLPHGELMDRAWTLARDFAVRPIMTLRYTKEIINFELKRQIRDWLGYGMALEGLGVVQLGGWRMNQSTAPPPET